MGISENFVKKVMGIIVVLILVSLTVAVLFLGLFIWAVKKGQFNDDYTPSLRMLDDDQTKKGNR